MTNTFSIVIPSYNSSEYISKTIESIINTKYDPNLYEIIIVNDGSTDNTLDIIEQLSRQYSNIKIYSKNNANWGSVINYVIENKLINNDYVVILDSDDLLSKNFFNIANQNIKNADMLLMSLIVKGKLFKYYASPHYWFFKRTVNKNQRYSVAFAPFSIVIKKDLFYQAPKLVENVSYQDYFLFFALMQKANIVRFTYKVSGIYNKYRVGNTMSANWTDKRFDQELVLHKKMEEINLSETLIFRVLMNGYTKKANEKNYKIQMKNIPKPYWLPWLGRVLFLLMYKIYLHKFVEIQGSKN
ncbi:glycosyltransferase family 2 protein [Mycoplasmoides pirum]|uniref:glycosyltransferase family 2 protein n=1 Tax=Mycoplasmoides pirum TaxID=2122 RepID=UPI0004853F11|nr:glycosyltransferase family 2 protein [Mycoplasmoides pirum]